MPLKIRWSKFQKDKCSSETDYYGVYELANGSGEIIYIGEGHIRTRLLSHFQNGSDPIVGASFYRVELTGSKGRAVQRQNAELEKFQSEYGQLPRFNQRKG